MWLTYRALGPAERALVRAAYAGREFAPLRTSPDQITTAPRAREWGRTRSVRGALIRQLLTDDGPAPPGIAPGRGVRLVHLRGVHVTGTFDLRDAVVPARAEFRGCWFDEESVPGLEGADLRSLTFSGCWLAGGLDANHAHVRGDLDLSTSHIRGCVRLRSAHVTGALVLSGADLDGGGRAAVVADRARLDGGMFANKGMRAIGGLQLLRAQISGQLDLSGGLLDGRGGDALRADGAQIAGGLFAKDRFRADGEVRLPSAHVAGQVVLSSAHLRNPGGCALNGDGLQVDGGLFAREKFESDGEVRLLQARVATQMDLTDATFRNPGADALSLDGARIVGDLFAAKGFQVDGTVRLLRTQISGQLRLAGARLRCSGGTALNAEHLEVGRQVVWDPAEVTGDVMFTFASAGTWCDTAHSRAFPVGLKGLRYDAVDPGPGPHDVSDRIAWLGRDPGRYSPLPYAQLASVLRAGGHDSDARRVLMASQRARLSQPTRWPRGAAVRSAFLRWTVGYGYRQELALVWLACLIAVAGLALWFLPGRGVTSFTALEGAPQPFNPWVYSLDVVLPFLSVGYDRWVPEGAAQLITLAVVVLGWLLVTAVVSAFAGILRRGE